MSIFKRDREIKRMIFNVYADLADQLEALKTEARRFEKRLDVDSAVNKALEKFVKKASKKLDDMKRESKDKRNLSHLGKSPSAKIEAVQDIDLEADNEATDLATFGRQPDKGATQ